MTGHRAADELFDIVGDPTEDGHGEICSGCTCSPGAGRSAVVGRHGDALKLRVAAPPEGDRANQAVAALLATTLGVPADAVRLTSGATSRAKRFRIGPVDLAERPPTSGRSGRRGCDRECGKPSRRSMIRY